jgi:hypothetical protein
MQVPPALLFLPTPLKAAIIDEAPVAVSSVTSNGHVTFLSIKHDLTLSSFNSPHTLPTSAIPIANFNA